MSSLRERLSPPGKWKRAVLWGCLVSVAYTGVVLGYSVHPSSNVALSGSVWRALGLYSLMAFGTVGVPVLLWTGDEIRGPAALMGLVLLFWHVLIYVPPIGSGQGDSPGFLFVFVFAPFYLVAYGLLTGGEYWLRSRSVSVTPRGT